jgi:phage shock protein A
MAMLKRLRDAIGTATQAILAPAEDPTQGHESAFDRQTDLLRQVQAARKAMAQGRRRLQAGAQRLATRVTQLEDEARAHIVASQETEAREALRRRLLAAVELNALRERIATVEEEESRLAQAAHQLSSRLEALEGQREIARARTQAEERIDRALESVGIGPAGLDLTLEDARRRSELLAADWSAIDRLLGVLEATNGTPLERQLQELDADDEIERQLAAVKAQISDAAKG